MTQCGNKHKMILATQIITNYSVGNTNYGKLNNAAKVLVRRSNSMDTTKLMNIFKKIKIVALAENKSEYAIAREVKVSITQVRIVLYKYKIQNSLTVILPIIKFSEREKYLELSEQIFKERNIKLSIKNIRITNAKNLWEICTFYNS